MAAAAAMAATSRIPTEGAARPPPGGADTDRPRLLQLRCDPGEPPPYRGFRLSVQALGEALLQRDDTLPTRLEQRRAARRQCPLPDAAVDRMGRHLNRAIPLEIANDHSDGLRRQKGEAGDVGAGQARIGV